MKRWFGLVFLVMNMGKPDSVGAIERIDPAEQPAGHSKTTKTRLLEAALALQTSKPLEQMNIYLVAPHPMKDNPHHQMIAHHFCHQVNQDFAQCVLFDGNTLKANLSGIEYIISEEIFEQLPEEEKPYWHPHNYEILSGQLIAPGLPMTAEKALLRDKMNSYGKTWHLWNTGSVDHKGDKVPMGPAILAWSLNHDGEVNPELLENYEEQMNFIVGEKKRQRKNLAKYAKPQRGVSAIADHYRDGRKLRTLKEVKEK